MRGLMGDCEAAVKVIYVGDGGGDFCPATMLKKDDVLCCRSGYSLHKKVTNKDSGVTARLLVWETGVDVLREFRACFNNKAT